MRVTWLRVVLTAAGVPVAVMPGWRGRGVELFRVEGVVWHHTATGRNWRDQAVENLLVRGRSDLPGPLSQVGLRRDGTWVLIADGRCNHNGYGTWGNQSIGIEAYNSGVGERWPDVQVDSWVRGTAAILRFLEMDSSRVKGHKETDPRRKIDPAGLDMDHMRSRIRVTAPMPHPPKPSPGPSPIDLLGVEMFLAVDRVGLFAVVDGVPIPFPSLAAMGEARRRSDGVPMMWLPQAEGQRMIEELLHKHKAIRG